MYCSKPFIRIVSLIVCILLCATGAFADIIDQKAIAQYDVLDARAQICDILLIQGAKYNSGILDGDVIKGCDDVSVSENNPVTRLDFFVMLSSAFGTLPEPKGGMRIMMPDAISFNGVPSWAKADIDNIVAARILTEAQSLDEEISFDEIMLLIQRVHALIGTSLSDDFYNTVNKEYMENAILMPGHSMEDMFQSVARKIDEDIKNIVDEIVSNPQDKNTPQQKVADFYLNYLNHDVRDKEGIKPIQKYLDELKSAQTLSELSDISFMISEEMAFETFASFYTAIDSNDSSKRIMNFATLRPSQSKDFYSDDTGEKKNLYLSHIESILIMAEFDETFAKEASIKVYDLERKLAELLLDPQEYYDPEKVNNMYTFNELKSIIPGFDLDRLLSVAGYIEPDTIRVIDVALLEEFGRLYIDENTELLKTVAIVDLVRSMGPFLGTDFEKEETQFKQKLFGIQGDKLDEEKAFNLVKETFSDYLAPIYIEKYFSEETKADIEHMCEEFIDEYKQRILHLSWMSDETKQKATRKLDAMKVNIGYPKKYDTETLDNAVIKSIDEGGSYFDNIISIKIETRKQMAREQFLSDDKDFWDCESYEVNAFYQYGRNAIYIPAGILQPPFYDATGKKEANYGAIGAIIAHEISHAFDSNGAKYDEYGNVNNWWTEKDYEAFSKLLDDIVIAFDGYETFPGIENDGILTLFENVADLGGLACSLSIIGKLDAPDYDLFFRSWATVWQEIATRNVMEYLAANDVHSLSKARVNIALGNFDEFHETYGIIEDDFLYIAPENRVGIW